jgi:hypothetical protein
MAGLIPQSFIDDLLNRTDIVDVVSSRVQLKKAGKNYTACCPFHKEKTPSFSVSPDKQFYYCFGCGAGGNALGFIMDHDNLDFPQASRGSGQSRRHGDTLARKAVARTSRDSRRIRRCIRCSPPPPIFTGSTEKPSIAQSCGGLSERPRPDRRDCPRLRPRFRSAGLGQSVQTLEQRHPATEGHDRRRPADRERRNRQTLRSLP